MHNHPEVKRHEHRFHLLLTNRFRREYDPNHQLFLERKSLSDHEIEVVSRALGIVQFKRIVERVDLPE